MKEMSKKIKKILIYSQINYMIKNMELKWVVKEELLCLR